jgi:hypothetical protein
MPKFNYTIVPLQQVCETQNELVNDIYSLWKETFGRVLERAGAELDIGDFFRSHNAGVLMYQDEVVAFNLFTNFNFQLHAHRDHPYFESLDAETIEAVTSKSGKVMTMEYFTVSPLWRKQNKEIHWGEILAGLGLHYMDHSCVELGVGTPRTDLKVDQMCERLGASIRGYVSKMNYECAVVVFEKKKQRAFENPLTRHWVNRLWTKYQNRKNPEKQVQFAIETTEIVDSHGIALKPPQEEVPEGLL